jgi:type IV pilus assembly protein PilA
MRGILKKNQGFTLIELMIVVAIIGILAAIAIPNFMMFMAKTKRSEVKYNLEAIYKAEISWYGEYDRFDNNFTTIRWKPAGTIYYYTFSVGSGIEGLPLSTNPMPAAAAPVANDNGFAAYGWGNIDPDDTIDVWHIDDWKNMVNDVDDLSS